MPAEISHRLRCIGAIRGLCWIACVALSCVLLRFPPEHSGLYPRCPVFLYLGWRCPGCGGTRAAAALLHGSLRGAFQANALLTVLLPAAALLAVLDLSSAVNPRWRRPRRLLEAVAGVPSPALAWMLAGIVLFGLWRNLA